MMQTHKNTACLPSILIVTIALLVSASVGGAVTITNYSVADAQIFGGPGFTNANRGAQGTMAVGDVGAGTDDRPLLRFSLANIPAGQTIQSATLRLTIDSTGGGGQHTNDFYRLVASWVEGNGVTGTGSGTSGVTWDSRDKAGTLANWTVPGASGSGTDRAASPSFTVLPSDITGSVLLKDATTDVQAWYTGSAANNGWLIQAQNYTGGSGRFTAYDTKEVPGGADALIPALFITYVPEPTTTALIGLGGLLWLRRRRS
jgi:hypothetical protein